MTRICVAMAWLLVGTLHGATAPVTAVSTSGNQLTSLTVSGRNYPQSQLAGATLTAFSAAAASCVLEPSGTGAPASGTRAGLVGDWSLDSGIINPAVGPATVTATFAQPIVNRPGADLVFMEINPGSSSDPMQVTINGVTLTVNSAEWGATGYATAGAMTYSTSSVVGTLAALESSTLTLGSAVTQNVFGVAIDLSDFGIAANASISQISFGSVGTVTFDPVFIAGFTGNGITPNGPVTLPYFEDFNTGAGAFTPSSTAEWSMVGSAYRNTISNTSAASSAAIQTVQLGGDPMAAPGFYCSGKFTVISNGNSANVVGLALFGSNSLFSGGVALPYYLIEVRPSGNSLRVRRVAINDTQFLPETTLSKMTLNTALAFSIECTGTYESGVLSIAVTVRQGTSSATFFIVDSEPLTVGWFGFRNRTNGGALTVDCDDFSLRKLSTLTFSKTPDPFARPDVLYSSALEAKSDIGAAVVLAAPTRPAWMSYLNGANGTGTLSGTPTVAQLGSHSVGLSASDDQGGALTASFNVSVLEPTGVFISEFLAENDSGLKDEDGDASDWIELFNSDSTVANVGGWTLSDNALLPKEWAIPAGVTIPAHGFLVIFASGKNRGADPLHLHTNFKLGNSAGGYLSLADPGGVLVSVFGNYPAQKADRSYGVYGSYTPRGYLLNPTPGAPNDAVGYAGFVADTKFSVGRGFYTSAQNVVVSCATAGVPLVYTLDGSTPTLTHGTQAPSPLLLPIVSSTTLRVAAFANNLAPSGPDTQSYIFLEDVRTQAASGAAPAGWPTGPINGQVIDYGMDPDVTGSVTPQQMKDALTALPTLSLVTDLPFLFDAKDGIYVNAYGREDGFECPVSVELINPDHTPGFQINAGLRIRGGASRVASNPKHNFHLYFRSQYGSSKLKFPLFGEEGVDEFDRVDLRTTQVISWHQDNSTSATYNRDEWCRATHGAMGAPYTRSRYYHLYINGQYWGIYGTQERADASWASSYFGGSSTDYDVIKSYVIPHRVDAADGDNVAWTQLFAAATAGFSTDAAYYAVQGLDAQGKASPTPPLLDVDNLIDYTLLHFYSGDTDAPVNLGVGAGVPKNFYAFRPRDGRFGFCFVTHDAESTMASADVTGTITAGNTLEYFNPRWLSQQLAVNAKYRLRFADRAQRALFNGGQLDNPTALARWQAIKAQISTAILGESARWGDAKSPTSPRTVANWVAANTSVETGFLATRRATLIAQLRSRALFPSIDAPAFSQAGGNVSAGYPLSISAPAATTLYYSLDGSDPQTAGAPVYSAPVVLNGVQVRVRARAKVTATGEWSALTEALFTLGAVPAAVGNLVIGEIHYNPAGSTDDTEFVELYNPGTSRLNLDGVSLGGGVVFSFGSLTLEPGARICVVENSAAFALAYGAAPVVAGQWSGALNNTSDTIILRAAGGTEIERVTYFDSAPWPLEADGNGYSLVRINALANADNAANWRASTTLGGNPGTSDSVPFSGAPLADADKDGTPALMEHFLGTSESSPGAAPLLAGRTLDGRATLSFSRRLGADNLTYSVEVSTDLVFWTTAASRSAAVISANNGMVNETWTADSAAPRQFLRLRVNGP